MVMSKAYKMVAGTVALTVILKVESLECRTVGEMVERRDVRMAIASAVRRAVHWESQSAVLWAVLKVVLKEFCWENQKAVEWATKMVGMKESCLGATMV